MADDPKSLILGAFEAFNRDGAEGFLGHLSERDALSPDFTIEIQHDAPNGGIWEGPEGFREMLRIWLEVWDEFELHPQEPEELAPGRYVIPTRQRAVAHGSGMEIDALYCYTVELDEGVVRRFGLFTERDLAERFLRGGEA